MNRTQLQALLLHLNAVQACLDLERRTVEQEAKLYRLNVDFIKLLEKELTSKL